MLRHVFANAIRFITKQNRIQLQLGQILLFDPLKRADCFIAQEGFNTLATRRYIFTSPKMTSDANLTQIVQTNEEEYDQQQPAISDSNDPLNDEEIEALNALQNSYAQARQGSTSRWLNHCDTCHIYLHNGGGDPSPNLAAFDLDGTLIKPKSKRKVPKDASDWQVFSVWTKVKLQQAIRENQARFVIFTNQNGVSLNYTSLEDVQERIEAVAKRFNIPCTVFVAIEKDKFRKPKTGMFRLFERSFNNSIQIDLDKSFYCGDAVGYPSFSDADIKFAQSLKIPFLPPDKFLRGVKPKLVSPSEQIDDKTTSDPKN